MHSLPLDPDKKQTKWEILQSIVKNNNFPQHLPLKLNRQILHKVNNNNKKTERMTKNLDYIYLPQPKDQKNYQFFQKYKYRNRVRTTTTLHHLIKPKHQPGYKNMKIVKYTKLSAMPATKLESVRPVAT